MRLCETCGRTVPETHFYRKSGTSRCARLLTWTQARRWRLMELVDRGMTNAEIAERMDTTEVAVALTRKRYGIGSVYNHMLSAREVARMMGVEEHTSARWLARGFMRGRKTGHRGPHRSWIVSREAVYAFVEDEKTWHLWTPERITDRMLRRYADQVRGDVRFLRAGEVARRMCVQAGTVKQWIHKGWLPARRWGNHWIDERDLERFELRPIGGLRRKDAA